MANIFIDLHFGLADEEFGSGTEWGGVCKDGIHVKTPLDVVVEG